jgi:AcrR family transcriptional regulator
VASTGRTRSSELAGAVSQAALAVLVEEGVDRLTVRRVAERAGVAPMGVYSRFGGKDGLIRVLLLEGFAGLHQAVAAARGLDPLDRVRCSCQAYREYALSHAAHYRLLFEELARQAPGGPVHVAADAAFGELVARCEDAVRAGRLTALPPEQLAQALWGACHGAVVLELAELSRADAGTTYDMTVDALLRGLVPQQPSA